MLGKCLENVRKRAPIVHCITNYVTVNDVANALLASGGSPIMSDEPGEVSEIVSICNALCVNIGTLNERTIIAMFKAAERANRLGRVVLLDPVGAGASKLRTDTASEIIEKVNVGVIRGNISEIKALAVGSTTTKGVDADTTDAVSEENLEATVEFVKNFAKSTGAIVAVTGKTDLVSDGEKCFVIRNGCEQMSKITGTGCMLSGIAAAFAAANQENVFEAVASAVCAMGLSGELGFSKMREGEGNATLRNHIIDSLYNMDGATLDKGARYEVK